VRTSLLFAIILLNLHARAQQGFSAIGQWKEYLPYNSGIDVTAGDNVVFCATPYSLFSVDLSDHSIERMSRVTGLAETGVSAIQYDEFEHKLFIAYSNSNIDIIYRNDIFNIPDIKRLSIAGDKSIYNIYPLNGNFYLSCGIGVIVIDGKKYEVKDSWFIGNGGNYVKVNGFTSDQNFFYAATEDGLKAIAVNNTNPANYANWQVLSGANGLPAGACRNVINVTNKIVVQKGDSLFALNGSTWSLIFFDGNPITSINSSGGKIHVCEKLNGPLSKVVVLNPDGTVAKTIQQNGATEFPRKSIFYNNEYWVADQYKSLSEFPATSSTASNNYILNSPKDLASGEMTEFNGVFYATAGAVNSSWNYQYNANGFYRYKNGEWKNFNQFTNPQLDTVLDLITVQVDPRDESVWLGSFGGGLVHEKPDESIEVFKQNSPIKPHPGDPTSYRVAGLKFDTENNLWISNFGAPQPLLVRKSDGSWKSFSVPFTLAENATAQIVIDESNQLWIVSPLGNGLICFNHNNTIDDLSDDHWRIYRAGAGNGNLPTSDVNCIAKDKSNFIWVGTTDGVGVIQCAESVFSSGCEAVLPIVQQDNFAGYLFKGENVQSIAVDGADRKWVATRNGVWLISSDAEKTIYHFTEDNSPLLSNDVRQIAIDSRTGVVYFATLKGICAFRSTATEATPTNSNVLVFPNPVPPGYGGMIAIRGLAANSTVKITELDGRLVFQTKALGGQAVWDGKDYKGRKISSGVYLVLVSNDDKTEKTVTKIVFISN
jgi:type IX secretion system protein PorZ/two component regulator with propeller domain